ncbi:NAD-dependent epimerase/dehydratase family protein [Alteromonas macleodii]|uniref:NAD-dependent epimerase/dehydratase family protein n=1 Tax=Alteromonas macleodii TaxID=28108 RepID=UPI003140476D
MNRVLILGGNGYIGGSLTSSLMASGYHVTVVSRSSTTNIECHRYIQLDLAKNDACKSLIVDEVDTVIDLVSYIPPNTENVSVSDIKRSLESYENLLKHINDKHYLFFSSGGTVYGNSSMPLSESAPLKPLSPYGIQKCMQEELIQKIMSKAVILRVTNPYGGSQKVKHGVGFVGHLLYCYEKGAPLTLSVPQCTSRDYIYISDLVHAVRCLIESKIKAFDVYNISTGVSSSLENLIDAVHDRKKLKIITDLSNFQSDFYISKNVLINRKIEDALGIKLSNKVEKYILTKSSQVDLEHHALPDK